MTLLKVLQQRLTCVNVPWMPSKSALAFRLINEIVLGEETDEIAPGEFTSHFNLYIEAMREVFADDSQINAFMKAVSAGGNPVVALNRLPIPQATKEFVQHTLGFIPKKTHEVAASAVEARMQFWDGLSAEIARNSEMADKKQLRFG